MALWSRINQSAPLLCLCAVLLSLCLPSSRRSDYRDMMRRCDTVMADSARLREDYAALIAWMRSDSFLASVAASLPSSGVRPGAAGADGPAPPAPAAPGRVPDGVGVCLASGVWYVYYGAYRWASGDASPWGVVDSVFPGGFVADGHTYSVLPSVGGLRSADG